MAAQRKLSYIFIFYMSNSQVNKKTLSLSDGLVIAFITALVYLVFLFREIGYATEFDIPLDVISVSEIGLASTIQYILLSITGYITKVNLIWIFSPRGDSLISSKIRSFVVLSLFSGFVFYPYLITPSWIWSLAILIGFFFFFDFIFPLITQRKHENYEEKIIAQEEINAKSVDIYKSLINNTNSEWLFPIILMFSLMFFSYGLGRKEALEQTSFLAIDGQPNWYILKIYNDFIVSAHIDDKSKKIIGDIELVKLKNGGSIRFRKVEIGRVNSVDNLTYDINSINITIPECNFVDTYCWVT